MIARTFVDTNILVYANDADAGEKWEAAQQALDELWVNRSGVVSTQVLQELYVNTTRKIRKPLSRRAARQLVADFSAWQLQAIGPAEILRASEIEEAHQISFWDGLIVAAASAAGAERIWSEDLSHGQRIEGVSIENPFKSAVLGTK